MIEVNVLKNQITITDREQITSGSVNVYYVHFHFSSHWDKLEKLAVFKTPSATINVPIQNDQCVVPWEVTTIPGVAIRMGVYGLLASEIVLPTIWTNLGTVLEGVFIGDAESGDHTPDVYDAILKKLEEVLDRFSNLKSDLDAVQDDIPTDDEIYMIIERYLKENPIGVDMSMIKNLIDRYLQENPIQGLTREDVQKMIDDSVGAAISDGY